MGGPLRAAVTDDRNASLRPLIKSSAAAHRSVNPEQLGVGPGNPRLGELLQLQRTIGNQAVGLVIQSQLGLDSSVGPHRQKVAQVGPKVVVQRAVGFEFETNCEIKKVVEAPSRGLFRRRGPETLEPFAKMAVLKPYPGFRMEADQHSSLGSCIEFVVDPPVAENARDELVQIIGELSGVATAIAGAPKRRPVSLDTLTRDPAHQGMRATVHGDDLVANPQVTGGISFDKIMTMLKEIGQPENHLRPARGSAPSQLVIEGPNLPGRAHDRALTLPPGSSQELRGLVALLTEYLKNGQERMGPPLNYAKLVSGFLLVRTDFASMFQKLPEQERGRYSADPESFVRLVMDAFGVAGADSGAPVLERGVRVGYTRGTPEYEQRIQSAATQLTRRAWLTSIAQGTDLLSSHHVPALVKQLEGLGGLGPTTDRTGEAPAPAHPIGPKDRGEGIVMEFRRMQLNVPHAQWGPLALSVFDYIKALNARRA